MKISVVIPAYNEEQYIHRSLRSLAKQILKPDEIIVVDNGSTDKTKEIAEAMGAKVINEKNKGIGFARRRGYNAATGDIIASTDADTVLPPDWLIKISKTFSEDPSVVAVGGPCNFDSQKNNILIRVGVFLSILGDKIINRGNNIPGYNTSFLKKTYLEIGGFEENYAFEDLDLSLRLKKVGKVVFLNDLRVITSPRRFEKKGTLRTILYYWINYLKFIMGKRNIKIDDIR